MAKFSPSKSFAGNEDPLDVVLRPPPDETPDVRADRLRREAEAKKVSDAIDESIREEKAAWKKNKSLFRLLLLGQSESDFQLTFAPQAWAAERASWRAVVQLNLVHSINFVLDAPAPQSAFGGAQTQIQAQGQPASAFASTTPQQPPPQPVSAFASTPPTQQFAPAAPSAPSPAHAKSSKPDFAMALVTVRWQPGLDKYDDMLPPNYVEILPKNMLDAFGAERFEWGKVPEFVPPKEVR
ncbi:hypothetical protein EVJ58_g5438 [Rhodofomes roseus]|uniref:Uncharacterized protein n=1 Tax=Rhodofomes roseus TaxID=34475 RepID=A0A4Y9YGD4_9APHY|nr:hypothetical protein EVJ58_g5438 [Rhodofomes roseus]